MNRALVGLGAAILATACGCAVDYGAVSKDLESRYQACLDAGMSKTDLVMQVGSPTSRETTDDGEIWIYEIETMGEYGPLRYTVWVVFDKRGVVDRIRSNGKQGAMASPNNRFLGLECRPRSGGKAQ